MPKKQQQQNPIPYVLTERDLQLLFNLYKYRYLSGSQVQKLLFPSQRTADRRLQLLLASDHLISFSVPGISERLVCLTKKAVDLIEENLITSDNNGDKIFRWDPGNSIPKDYYFVKHFLAVNQFRIDLTLACNRSAKYELAGYLPEYYGTRSEKGGVVKHIKDFVLVFR